MSKRRSLLLLSRASGGSGRNQSWRAARSCAELVGTRLHKQCPQIIPALPAAPLSLSPAPLQTSPGAACCWHGAAARPAAAFVFGPGGFGWVCAHTGTQRTCPPPCLMQPPGCSPCTQRASEGSVGQPLWSLGPVRAELCCPKSGASAALGSSGARKELQSLPALPVPVVVPLPGSV